MTANVDYAPSVAQGVPAIGTGVAAAPAANQLDTFPFTVSLTGSLSASNYQALPLKSDYQGNLASREQYAPVAEDNFNGVFAMAMLPTTASVYTPTFTGSMGTRPGVIKASPGVLYKVWVTSRATGSNYLQIFNNTTGPSGVPIASFQIASGSAQMGNIPDFDGTPWGIFLSTGISIGLSSQNTTYNAATATDYDWAIMFK